MQLKNKFLILLQSMLGVVKNNPQPPTLSEWHKLPPFVREIIVDATFRASNGEEVDVYLAHWMK